MPFYEYRCQECGYQFEKLVRNDKEIPDVCPECGKPALKKLFSTFSTGSSSGSSSSVCADGSCSLSSSCSTGCCPTGACPL